MASVVVGTGIEQNVVRDSRLQIRAEENGVVEFVDANEIIIRYERSEEEMFVRFDDDVLRYKLPKFR